MALQTLFFWNHMSATSNQWRPQPGNNPSKYKDNLPESLKRTDIEATVVDAAPFVAGAGALAHVSQIHAFGFTAPASIFKNIKTMKAIHRAVLIATPIILVFQAAGIEYRNMIPRWAHDRELRRDEEEVRQHVDAGMTLGAVGWAARMAFKLGMRYWSPIDILAGGALADLLQREYLRAHNM